MKSILLSLIVMAAATSHAVAIFSPETFGDGGAPDTGGWSTGVGGLGGAEADAGAGGAGDHALRYTANNPNPQGNNGFHFLHPVVNGIPNPDFLGDYLAAGVFGLQFDARHSGDGDSVSLLATLFDDFADGTDWAVSTGSATVANTATDWQTYTISLFIGDMTAAGANGMSVIDILSAVAQIGLRNDPLGTGPFSPSPVAHGTTVYFDNVMLVGALSVPEPATIVLLLTGCLGGLAFGSRKKA